jgi:hypothetical protein
MSAQISPEFGEAYKSLSLAKKSVMAAGGATSAYLEEVTRCATAISKANLSEDTNTAACKALSSVVADVMKSAEKHMRLANGETLSHQFEASRKIARTARSLTQKNLSYYLEKDQLLTHPPVSSPVAKSAETIGAQTWNPANISEYKGILGLPQEHSDIIHFSPGSTHNFNAGQDRNVTIKDKRSASGKAVALHIQAVQAALDASEVGAGNIELHISNSEDVYGHARVLPDGTHVVTVNVKDKETYAPAAAYVMNNSLVHELRHVHQAQNTPHWSSKYNMETTINGYTDNKYEVEARSYGQLADHTGTKDKLPEGLTAKAASVWAILPG